MPNVEQLQEELKEERARSDAYRELLENHCALMCGKLRIDLEAFDTDSADLAIYPVVLEAIQTCTIEPPPPPQEKVTHKGGSKELSAAGQTPKPLFVNYNGEKLFTLLKEMETVLTRVTEIRKEFLDKLNAARGLPSQKPTPTTPPFKCPTCKSVGFEPSIFGQDRCTFCDGTEGGLNPITQEPENETPLKEPPSPPSKRKV
jgi:hypothetical protein